MNSCYQKNVKITITFNKLNNQNTCLHLKLVSILHSKGGKVGRRDRRRMEQRDIEPNGADEDWDNVMVDTTTGSSTAEPLPFVYNSFSPGIPPGYNDSMQTNHSNDCDMDANSLIQQFDCLGTTDKDVLVSQLQKFIGPSLNKHAAQFFLDMNNWNLQRAIGSYFDLTTDEQAAWNDNGRFVIPAISMSLVGCSSSTEVSVAPNSKFSVTWKLRNDGSEAWPTGTHLKLTNYPCELPFPIEKVFLHSNSRVGFGVSPGEECNVNLELTAPSICGSYLVNYELMMPEGPSFGSPINIIIQVASDETVDLSQQFQNLRWNGSGGGGGGGDGGGGMTTEGSMPPNIEMG